MRKDDDEKRQSLIKRLEKKGMTQSRLAQEVGCHRQTLRRHTKRSKHVPDGAFPHVTPEESPLSARQQDARLKYAKKNKDRNFVGENVTFFDDTFMRLDGTPNRKNNPQWRGKASKKPLEKSKKRKHPPKHDFGFDVNARGGISELFWHSKRRKLKRGENKGKLTFDHQRMTQASMVDVVRDVIIPFMKRTRSRTIIMDCTTVYHNETIYEELRENGIEPYPSGGRPFDVEGGYPPNSHDCMSCELTNDRVKKNAQKAFERLR